MPLAVCVIIGVVILFALYSKDRVKAVVKVFGVALLLEAEKGDGGKPPMPPSTP